MQICITGGTGFIGSALIRALQSKHEVTSIARTSNSSQTNQPRLTYFEGDTSVPGDWQKALVQHDVIINLAGASIFTRWNDKKKQAIYASRVMTTKNIIAALQSKPGKVKKLINASAVGYYGFHGDEILTETAAAGTDFLATVCHAWEAAALQAQSIGIDVSICRFGIVLGKNGGSLQQMAANAKRFMGGRLGSGNQWVSWIHADDLVAIITYLINNTLTGAINCCSPDAVTNKTLTETLAATLHKPTLVPMVPGFVIKLVLGEFGAALLCGQRVYPQKLLDAGFKFRFPHLPEALRDLLLKQK